MKTAHLVVVSLLLTVIATTNADSLSVPLKNYQESVVFTFAYCRDGNFRADFCVDSVLRIYDIRDGKLKKSIKLPFSRLTLFTKSYSPSKQELISGSDSVIYKINIDKGNVSAFPLPRSAAASPLFFLDDYTRMVSCDSVYRLWDLNSGTERRCFADLDTVEFAAFSPDNKSVLLLHKADSSAELRDAVTDSVIMTYHIPGMGFSYAVFSPDGERFLVPVFSKGIVLSDFAIMDVKSGELIRIDSTARNLSCNLGWAWKHDIVLGYSMDRSRIIQGDDDNVCVIDAETGEKLAHFCGGSPVFGGTQANGFRNDPSWFSPDGDTVFVPSSHEGSKVSKPIVIETATNRKSVKYFRQDRPTVLYSGFSSSGQPLFTGKYFYTEYNSGTGFYKFDTLVFWNGENDEEFRKRMRLTQPEGVGSYFYEYHFTHDGRRMIQQFGSSGSLDIFSLSDTCPLIARTTASGVISQDKKAVYVLKRIPVL
ncbi:MAG TPA: WD40 repeat domain-containing protein [Chitinispirillaceae bacterium]|nr:WD40 repeat domain-containing protein [Chitinispirillaceae bacterium]